MRIGILTFHRAHNYGAVLQCYALQEIIKQKGHYVKIIDYRQPYIDAFYTKEINYKYILHCFLKIKPRKLHNYIKLIYSDIKAKNSFVKFRRKKLNCSKRVKHQNIPKCFDRYIIGSDQVWGIHCYGGYDPVYFGDFHHMGKAKIYGYAISSNGDFLDYLGEEGLKHTLSRFSNISFREKKIQECVMNITGRQYGISLDPTLVADIKIWTPLINKKWLKKNYVVLYHIRGSKLNPGLIETIVKEFAQKKGYELVNLSTMNYTVDDFVTAIKYAKCVFTSSFHATVFSILWGTPFYSFVLNDGHDERYVDLLHLLDLDNHLISESSPINNILPFDQEKIIEKIAVRKKESQEYINTILSL